MGASTSQGWTGADPADAGGQGPVLDIYARLSRAANGDTITVEDQVEQCTEKILARGGRVGKVFTDNSLSAWQPRVVRKNWLLLMERLESGTAGGVMVYDLYRFSRKIMEGERLLEAAQNGLRVWALAGEYDLTTADGRAHFREAIAAAAKESDKSSERIRRGKFRAARGGGLIGGGRGWALPGLAPETDTKKSRSARVSARTAQRRRRMETDERVNAERALAKDCIERSVAGESLGSLVTELNERGAAGERAALTVSGARWTNTSLVRALSRPAIAGLVIYHGDVFGESAEMEPVIDREEWEKFIAKAAARRTGRPPSDRHMLTRSMKCGDCGELMKAYLRTAQGTYDDGTIRKEYRCLGCGRNGIDGRLVEEAVVVAVTARLRDPARADLVSEQMRQADNRRGEITGKIQEWEATADELAGRTAKWGVARVEKALDPILRTLDQLRDQLAALDEVDTFGAASDDAVAEWDRVRAEGDVGAQRQIVRRVFPDLTVAPPARRNDQRPERLLWNG